MAIYPASHAKLLKLLSTKSLDPCMVLPVLLPSTHTNRIAWRATTISGTVVVAVVLYNTRV